MRLGVSSTAASTPTGVYNQRFEALFPCTGTLGCVVCHPVHQLLPHRPAAPLPILLHNPPPHWVRQPPPCSESSLPCCLSPPFLPVWVSVSSLSPWWLDFHAVQFSGSSGCFLFLNCFCPSLGCVRRHSVSTYTSILAGSPRRRVFKSASANTCRGSHPPWCPSSSDPSQSPSPAPQIPVTSLISLPLHAPHLTLPQPHGLLANPCGCWAHSHLWPLHCGSHSLVYSPQVHSWLTPPMVQLTSRD